MVDMGSIAAVAASLRVAGDITKAAIDLRDAQMLQGKIIELNKVILDAQSNAMGAQLEQFTLIERVRALEADVAKLEAWEREKQRYQLESLPPGILMYTLKPGMENGDPPHKICANCYNQGVKSFLNNEGSSNGLTTWKCHRCGFHVDTGHFVEPSGGREPSSWMA